MIFKIKENKNTGNEKSIFSLCNVYKNKECFNKFVIKEIKVSIKRDIEN